MTSMAPDLDRPRPTTRNTLRPLSPPPARAPRSPAANAGPGVPSGPPLRLPGPPEPGASKPGPPLPAPPPTAAPDSPNRRRFFVPAIGVFSAVALVGTGVYLAFRDDDEDHAAGPDPTSTAVPVTFAVDLSTGDDDTFYTTVPVPAPTLPLPSIGLPMPGVTAVAPGTLLPAGQPPDDLGDDAVLDDLADQCYAGDMAACDDLYFAADVGTAYLTYGDTCAGRQPEHTTVTCVNTFAHAVSTTTG